MPGWRSAGISSAEGVRTMNDHWTDRLSEYLDGDLTAGERTALEAHLAACGVCRVTLDELRRVVARAQALDDRPPAADLWPGIAEHIGVVSLAARRVDGRGRRRLSFTMPQLAAADPANAYLNQRLAQEPRRKLELLRQAATLASARS